MRPASLRLMLCTILALPGGAQAGLYDNVKNAVITVQGELAKETKAYRKVREAVIAYEMQAAMQRDAVEIGEKMRPKHNICSDLVVTDKVNQVSGLPGRHAIDAGNAFEQKGDRFQYQVRENMRAQYDHSVQTYCSALERTRGWCNGGVPLPQGDVNAASLLAPDGDDDNQGQTYNLQQMTAAQDYVDRLVPPSSVAPDLLMKCDTPQCRGYHEARKRANAMLSASRHSLNVIVGRRIAPQDSAPSSTAGAGT